jgi:predicted GTPase
VQQRNKTKKTETRVPAYLAREVKLNGLDTNVLGAVRHGGREMKLWESVIGENNARKETTTEEAQSNKWIEEKKERAARRLGLSCAARERKGLEPSL